MGVPMCILLAIMMGLLSGVKSTNKNVFVTNRVNADESVEKCSKDEECTYSRKCEKGLCECPSSDLGDNCEKVPDTDCTIENCISSGGSCEYNSMRVRFCNCKENIWDEKKVKCVEKCSKNDECTYGQMCIKEKCECPSSDLGDNCEKVPDINCTIENCISSGGSCEYNSMRVSFCNCKEKIWDEKKVICVDIHRARDLNWLSLKLMHSTFSRIQSRFLNGNSKKKSETSQCDEKVLRNYYFPLHFHQVHGESIKLTKNRTVASRFESFSDGIVFSDRTVSICEPVYVKLLETSKVWDGTVRIGFTTHDPMSFESKLPEDVFSGFSSLDGNWAIYIVENLAKKGSVLYFYADQNGDVHYGADSEEYGIFEGVNTSSKLWAVIDLYGRTVAVELVDQDSRTCNKNYTECQEKGGTCVANSTTVGCKYTEINSTYFQSTKFKNEKENCKDKYYGCLNSGGACKVVKDGIFCQCPDIATYSTEENKCTVEDSKCDDKFPGCRNSGGVCKLGSGEVSCECPDITTYRTEEKMCTVEDAKCDDKFPGCLESGGVCKFESGKVFCQCPDITTYKTEEEMCAVEDAKCDEKFPGCRKSGGVCKFESVSCECPGMATYSTAKEMCTVDDDICDSKIPDCRATGGTCVSTSTGIECQCPEGTVFDSTGEKCFVSKDVCEEKFPFCIKTGGNCELVRWGIYCKCSEGKIQDDKKEACTEVKDCKCENGRCVTDKQGNTKCACKQGYALQDEFMCKPCDCGSLGKCFFILNLTISDHFEYQKKCVCDAGSAEKDGVCVDPCTNHYCYNGGRCIIENDAFRCFCLAPYSGEACEINMEYMKMTLWGLCSIAVILILIIGFMQCRKRNQKKQHV